MRLKQFVNVRLVVPIIRIYYNKTKSFAKPGIFNLISGKSIRLFVTDVPLRYMSYKSNVLYSKNVSNSAFIEDIFLKEHLFNDQNIFISNIQVQQKVRVSRKLRRKHWGVN